MVVTCPPYLCTRKQNKTGKTEIYLTDTECNFISVAQKVLTEGKLDIKKAKTIL